MKPTQQVLDDYERAIRDAHDWRLMTNKNYARLSSNQPSFDWYYEDKRRENPWCNGRIAFSAIVSGLAAMLVWSLAI